jgi:acetyl-CoA C-acetyltransferase
MNEVFIYDAVRTPRGRGKKDGALNTIRPVELARIVLEALRERNHLDTAFVEDVILGCVTPVAEQGANIAKTAAMVAKYAETVSGITVNRFCGSGLEAVNQAAARIGSGSEELLVAGGVESMSRVPLGSDGGAWGTDPQVATQTSFVPQGISADLIATMKNFSRKDLDSFSAQSHQRAAIAYEQKRFQKSLIPVLDQNGDLILDRDELLRPDTTAESLGKLKPAFETMGLDGGFDAVAIQRYPTVEKIEHVHHAGNSSGIVDGAAAILLGSKDIGQKLGLKARAKIKAFAVTAAESTIMLTGPMPATQKALKRAGMDINSVDLFEVNEAFAVVVLNFMRELNVPHEKVNVNGGAIALGHPLGATGAMILGTLLDELERQKKQTGLATLCIGGGMGIATIIELV